ncbi:MAG: hypothetical protein AAGG72_04080, partial [Pseudomonadota bacterium]
MLDEWKREIVDCEQGTPEWHLARAGRVTSSGVADVVRQGRTKGSSSIARETYKAQLLLERLTGVVQPTV